MEEAAAQERVGQFLLVVRGDEHDGAQPRLDHLAGLVDEELHAVELLQEVVRELDVGLVDLVDEQDRARGRLERLPELAPADVILDVLHALVAELAVAQAADGVVIVEALLRLGGGLDVPFDERRAERVGHLAREHGLAGAGLAFDQQRAFEHDGRVHRDAQVVRGDVGFGSFKTHRLSLHTPLTGPARHRSLRKAPCV